jgi:hypothetical protein
VERDEAERIANEWLEAWNARDVDAVMAHFHPDVTVVSPLAATIGIAPDGKVRGRDAVRAYYEQGLAGVPDLHFTLETVLVGVDGLTVLYRTHRGQQVVETMLLDGETVVRVMVHYGPPPTA